ncbi:hypothetical protein [Bacillus sp. FJAT-45350]|uniref:hypothetical protein n=1 Tax=Bacillus sp. FJAT-45350 TaxID=2011014 RepID=UPI0015CCC717|nr:hypothetical protein [Bacillus sp. FJAT-45350]
MSKKLVLQIISLLMILTAPIINSQMTITPYIYIISGLGLVLLFIADRFKNNNK